jgi:hypothetical protein
LADTYLNYTGKLIKLIDQNDGTYALAAKLTPGAVNIGEVTLDEGHKYAGQMAVVLLKGVTTTGGVGSITDDSKDIPAGLLAGKYIKVDINGIEYVREILQNSGNAITFKDILAAASAVSVYGEASGGQVTTVVDEVGAAGNGYTMEFIAALTDGASTEAVKDGKAITVTLGTNSDGVKAGASIGTGTDGVVDILVDAVGVAGNAYSIEVVLSEEADADMTATLSGKKITVTLGTDGDGLIDANKNIATLVAAAIDDLGGFTATASNEGSAPLVIEAEKPFMGGSDPTVNATGAAVATVVNALPGVSASMTGSGGVVAAGQGTFSGGLDEIAVPALAEYEIIDLASVDGGGSGSSGNTELLERTEVIWDDSKLSDNVVVPLGSGRNVLITVINSSGQLVAIDVTLEHEVALGQFIPYMDATGDPVKWQVAASGGQGVFGVIQGFPMFRGGRIVLTGATAPTSGETTSVQVQEV